jgi:hypothetical protein
MLVMIKQTLLKFLNPLLPILLICQLITGFFNEQIGYETFEALHPNVGIALAVVALIHVVLNWSWIKSTYFKRKKT